MEDGEDGPADNEIGLALYEMDLCHLDLSIRKMPGGSADPCFDPEQHRGW